MLLVLGAVVLGLLVGLIFGGSFRKLGSVRLRLWPLALLGLALQLMPIPSSLDPRTARWVGAGLLVLSYLLLLAFVLENIQFPGFPILIVGILLNIFVISLNRGMPVTDAALQAAEGQHYRQARQHLIDSGGVKHHLARPDDLLLPLADVIAIPAPVKNVFSVGDLIAYLGVAWVLAAATRGGGGKHRIGAPERRQLEETGLERWSEPSLTG